MAPLPQTIGFLCREGAPVYYVTHCATTIEAPSLADLASGLESLCLNFYRNGDRVQGSQIERLYHDARQAAHAARFAPMTDERRAQRIAEIQANRAGNPNHPFNVARRVSARLIAEGQSPVIGRPANTPQID